MYSFASMHIAILVDVLGYWVYVFSCCCLVAIGCLFHNMHFVSIDFKLVHVSNALLSPFRKAFLGARRPLTIRIHVSSLPPILADDMMADNCTDGESLAVPIHLLLIQLLIRSVFQRVSLKVLFALV
jgi:hypothetical protein